MRGTGRACWRDAAIAAAQVERVQRLQGLLLGRASELAGGGVSLAQGRLAAAVGDGEGTQVGRRAGAGRVVLARALAVEVCAERGIGGRGQGSGATSAQSRGRVEGAEGAVNGLDLLFAQLHASSVVSRQSPVARP